MEEKQMKTLGGYEIVDEKARKDIETISEKADEAYSLAKGATKAFVYDTYSDMIAELNALDKAELLVNFHVMIREVCVPDLWISGISDEHVEYTYTSNEDFIVDLTEDGIVQVGYFVLSALETQKVDLSEYVKKDDFATPDKPGIMTVGNSNGLHMVSKQRIGIFKATDENIRKGTHEYQPIVPSNQHLSVFYGLAKASQTDGLEYTDEEKQSISELFGGVQKKYVDDLVGNIETLLGGI